MQEKLRRRRVDINPKDACLAARELLPDADGQEKVEPLHWKKLESRHLFEYALHLHQTAGKTCTENTVKDIRCAMKSLYGDFKQEETYMKSVNVGMQRHMKAARGARARGPRGDGGACEKMPSSAVHHTPVALW